jgi:hypothetical protein
VAGLLVLRPVSGFLSFRVRFQTPPVTLTALVRASTQRLGQTGLVYKPLSDSPALEFALVWRAENHRSVLLSFLNAIYPASQPSAGHDHLPYAVVLHVVIL